VMILLPLCRGALRHLIPSHSSKLLEQIEIDITGDTVLVHIPDELSRLIDKLPIAEVVVTALSDPLIAFNLPQHVKVVGSGWQSLRITPEAELSEDNPAILIIGKNTEHLLMGLRQDLPNTPIWCIAQASPHFEKV
jgi:hypothetical protein